MAQRDFDIYENRAVEAAGAKAGKLLDEKFGKTDLASLEHHEWLEFCRTLIDEFGNDLARRLSSPEETPF